jgi:phage terminase large subunit
MVKITTDMLNRAYYDLKLATIDSVFVILYGGRNSSKSHSMMQWLAVTLWNSNENAIFYRATSSDLRVKAYEPFIAVCESMGMADHLVKVFHNLKKEVIFPNGNKLMFDFIDKTEAKSKGIANVTYVIYEEVDQIKKLAFQNTMSSFRGNDAIRHILLFNPVDERHWLKNTFFDNPNFSETHLSNITKVFHYTIEDNRFATKQDYLTLESIKDTDENLYRIYRYGEWGTINVEDPFIDQFKYNKHTTDHLLLNLNYKVFVSFDFGKTDSCVVGQFFEEYEAGDEEIGLFNDQKAGLKILAEYRVKNAEQNAIEIVSQIVEQFGTECDYIVVGDTAGGGNKGVNELYYEIKAEFQRLNCFFVRYVKMFKPTHKSSRRLVNWVFKNLGENVKISKNCPKLIKDLQIVRVDEFGNIDKNDCVQYDKGHLLDCLRYMIQVCAYKTFATQNPNIKAYNDRIEI